MGGGGAFLGGLVGFMLGGPIGGIIGAVFGNAVTGDEAGQKLPDGAVRVNCPACRSSIAVGGPGRWICPACRSGFTFDGLAATVEDNGGYSDGEDGYYERGAGASAAQAQEIFFLTMFSLLALMAKADGVVSREEITLVDDFIKKDLQLPADKREMAIKIFNAAKNSGYSFEGMAEQFYSLFKNERNILMTMFDLLLRLAHSDGVFHENEERMILSAKKIFKVSDYEYESFLSRYRGAGGDGRRDRRGGGRESSRADANDGEPSLESCYAALGCKPSDGVDRIKEAYKKLAKDYHPDAVIAKGLPEDFVKFATQRFQQIQQAYERIRKARNF